ncbi:MAG: DNA polymerase I [Fusobacteriaceae bacterium]|jgi:DNA polymerase-1|nr:DNA polymerase I [Fusobacteriaceae bacterium]
MERLILLDTSAMMYRAYYANMHFFTRTEPTGAVYGFTNTLLSVINTFSPDYMAAAFDVKRSELRRTQLYEFYKDQREAVPEDLLLQIPRIEETLDCFGIKRCKVKGYEADDVMGTLAARFAAEDLEVVVVTGDKDLAQILAPNIKIALLGRGEGGDRFKLIETYADVVAYLGVGPDKIPDLFGLIGDATDGIPGVRKIGPKKAIPLLERFGTIEGVYENLDKLTEIPGIGKSLVENIKEDRETAFLSRTLATIDKEAPVKAKLTDLAWGIDRDNLYKLFKKLEFKGLIKKLKLDEGEEAPRLFEEKGDAEAKAEMPAPEAVNRGAQGEAPVNPVPERVVIPERALNFLLADTDEAFSALKEDAAKATEIACFVTAAGLALSTPEKDWYIPLGHLSLLHKNYDEETVRGWFSTLEANIVSWNAKLLWNRGFSIKKLSLDLMIGWHLLTSSSKEDMDLPIEKLKETELRSYADTFGKEDPVKLAPADYGLYLAERSKGLLEISGAMISELQEKGLYDVLCTIEQPLIRVLSAMERTGIAIDPGYFAAYGKELGQAVDAAQERIYGLAMGSFNLNSPKQLAEVLFLKLNIPPVKKTKTGLSTDVDVLEDLSRQGYEIAEALLEYRKLSKLKSTYVDPLPAMADGENRIHTTFNQIGTATGRLSSQNPNLQNIPVRSEEGIRIREGFVAGPGKRFLGIDYSQIELRVLGEMSGDANLIEAYRNGEDLHARTAARLFAAPGETVTREQRAMAKTINFSIIYGKTPFGLSRELNITPREAGDYIEKYFAEYPAVKDFERRIIKGAEQKGWTETWFKRRRYIDGINSANRNIKNQAERMAVNSVIQGTAAEIIKKAMCGIWALIRDCDDIRLLLQVHDELIFEIDEDRVDYWQPRIEEIMRTCVTFTRVPLEVNSKAGPDWAKIK